MHEDDRTILSSLWLPPRRQQLVAADLGLSVPAMARRGLQLLHDLEAEQDEPVLVHQARRVIEGRARVRRAS